MPELKRVRLPPFISARQVLADSKGVMRLEELHEKAGGGESAVNQELDHLEGVGEIERLTVGEHTMIKTKGELREETKDRGGPRSDKPYSYSGADVPSPYW